MHPNGFELSLLVEPDELLSKANSHHELCLCNNMHSLLRELRKDCLGFKVRTSSVYWLALVLGVTALTIAFKEEAHFCGLHGEWNLMLCFQNP